ncbi:MAG: TrkH family potassium uptake protein [Prevotellaceae bacterium]|jgi:trk system potassium uptake protein TrkH|nr:TrkH family potassium uptake protein [Prevotellaceae bacterium]
MRYPVIIRYTGLVLALNAVVMLLSAGLSLCYAGDGSLWALITSAVITATAGIVSWVRVPPAADITAKEGATILAFSWLASCLFGMLPYLFYGHGFSLVNAWFESVSGFTTTGATILQDVEALPKGLLFWRSATHWIGGLGVVFMMALILPSMRGIKRRLVKTEMTTLANDNFKLRVVQTVRIISLMYAGLTLLETLLLRAAGMDWFDAVNHAFSTISTGGFSTRNASILAFQNPLVELIITLFMLVSGIHFGLLYMALSGHAKPLWRSPAVRFYLTALLAGIILVTLNLYIDNQYPTLAEAFRHSAFQIVSIGSTTGFTTAGTALWPTFSVLILIYFSFQCACSGSTSGGVKADRILILFKAIKSYIRKQQHPNAIIPVRVGGSIMDDDTVHSAVLFIVTYICLLVVGTLLLVLFNSDILTGFSAALASLGNVGHGFGGAAMGNYAGIPFAGKLILTLLMLFGRLEIFGLLLVLFVRTWR